MKKSKDDNPHKFVTRVECASMMEDVKGDLKAIKNTLIGENMRGGLVSDVQAIKSATSIFKTVIVPVVISVSAALITYGILQTLK